AVDRHAGALREDVRPQPSQRDRDRRADRADHRSDRRARVGPDHADVPARAVNDARPRVSFIVPAYNEAATIADVLERVEALELEKQVGVVDDGSPDAAPAVLEQWTGRNGIVVLRQENRGKGAAIRAAIPVLDGEITVIQDADMEYDPAEVPGLIDPIERGVADVVFGSRLKGGRPQRA